MRPGLVLAYHSVSPRPWGALCTPLPAFRRQVRWLSERGWRGVSLREWCSGKDPRAVAVTFDDGYRDNLVHALPVLLEAGFGATVFAVAGYVDRPRPFPWVPAPDPEARSLDWEELRALAGAGVEIGSHTMSHACLADISPEEAAEEIGRSRSLLEQRLQLPVDSFCYPFGRFSPGNCLQVLRAGYRRAVGPLSTAIPRSPFTIPRVGVHGHNSLLQLRLKTSPVGRLLLACRRRGWRPREPWPRELWEGEPA